MASFASRTAHFLQYPGFSMHLANDFLKARLARHQNKKSNIYSNFNLVILYK
jgi:hypothetical protein